MKNVQIRLNERRYDESVFLNGGIEHIDLQVVTLRTSVPRSLRPSVPPSLGPSVPPSFPFLSFIFCCPPPPILSHLSFPSICCRDTVYIRPLVPTRSSARWHTHPEFCTCARARRWAKKKRAFNHRPNVRVYTTRIPHGTINR